jgi:hypothetical protein
MKLPGWEKVTSAEQYRQMIEAEYHRLKEVRAAGPGSGVGLEEVKLRLFLSLIERPDRSAAAGNDDGRGVVCEFPSAQAGVESLFNDDQPASDQVA